MLMSMPYDHEEQDRDDDALSTVEAETSMLAMLLTDNRRVDLVADVLRGEDFSEPVYGRIFDTIVALVSAGTAATAITVGDLLVKDEALRSLGGKAFLASISGGSALPFLLIKPQDQAAIISDRAARRRLRLAAEDLMSSAADISLSLPELVDRTDAALVASIERREASAQSDLAECVGLAISRIEEIRANEGRVGFTTGLEEFDTLLGGIEAGQVLIVGARPSMGKTALACSTALGWARSGHGVFFASLEMKRAELGMRMLSDLCCRKPGVWVPFDAITNGTVTNRQFETLRQAEDAIRSWPLIVDDVSAPTMARLFLKVRRAKRRMAAKGQTLRVVLIDYLQLIAGDNPRASIYETVSEISRGLKQLAKELDVGVVALAQLSRQVEAREDKRPQLSDLRDSGQIEQDADGVLFLYREEYYLERAKPKQGNEELHEKRLDDVRGQMTLICAKRRQGRMGSVNVRYLQPYQAIRGAEWGRM